MIDETPTGTAQRITAAGDDYAETMNSYFRGNASTSAMVLANKDFGEVLSASDDEIAKTVQERDTLGADTFLLEQARVSIAQAQGDVKTHTYVRAHAFALKAAHTLTQSR